MTFDLIQQQEEVIAQQILSSLSAAITMNHSTFEGHRFNDDDDDNDGIHDKGGEKDTRMTTLIIRALETAPHSTHTVAELYQRLVELNPSLIERKSDWQSTVRHTLSTSTMFVLVNDTRPGQWMYNPDGERSTHKNRRCKGGPQKQTKALSAKVTKKRRLGTTLRRGEKGMTWPKVTKKVSKNASTTSNEPQESRWSFSLSSIGPCGTSTTHQQLYSNVTPIRSRRNSDVFMDDVSLRVKSPITKKHQPRQWCDTTKEPFPPLPQIDAFHQDNSQSSSSISFSQYSSQFSQSQTHSQ